MDIQALTDFVAVVQAGSISAGARACGEPKQSVSRRVLALEESLDLRLFERNTRSLRLTADGSLLYERVTRILADLDDTRRTLADRRQAPEGYLRISAPVLLGQSALGAIIAKLVKKHAQLRIEVVLSDRRVDLIEEGFDAAIRVGPVDDSSLIARLFAYAENIVVAAPSLIASAKLPKVPADLATRSCILFGQNVQKSTWRFAHENGSNEAIQVRGPIVATSLKFILDAACAGAGFASVPAFLATEAIARGEVRRVLPHWNTGRGEVRVVFASRRMLSARLRAFIDALVEAFPDQTFR
jgi:DNA-binding transcriptional LysR family regulator